MTIVKLKGYQFTFPEDIRKNAHIQKDQELVIEATPDNIVQIKPVVETQAKLKKEKEWSRLATASFASDWENEKDDIYDNWQEHYHVQKR